MKSDAIHPGDVLRLTKSAAEKYGVDGAVRAVVTVKRLQFRAGYKTPWIVSDAVWTDANGDLRSEAFYRPSDLSRAR